MPVSALLTHEYPDLDGLVGCWLLRRFGGETFPGVQTAELRFQPAAFDPGGMSAEALEAEGIIAVDIGGGRFDNHIRGRIEGQEGELVHCSTSLIAEELGVADQPGLRELVEFVRLQDTQGRSLASRNPVDHAMALVSVLRGLHLLNGEDFAKTYEDLAVMLDAIQHSTEGGRAAVEWLREERPVRFTHAGREHVADNHFDAAFGYWLLERRARAPVSPVTLADLERDGLACRVIARSLGCDQAEELGKLLGYADLERIFAAPGYLDDVDASVTGLNVLRGHHRIAGDPGAAAARMLRYFDAVVAIEHDWFEALAQFPGCSRIVDVSHRKRRVRIAAFESSLTAMTRVARFKSHPDLCIHRDPSLGAIGITLLQHHGILKDFTFDGRGGHPTDRKPTGQPRLDSLAARVRMAESIISDEPLELESINDIGLVGGWFLHQSLRIFAKGSRKARDVPPSRIPFEDLIELVAGVFDPGRKLPDRFCPPGGCPGNGCRMRVLDLPNCRNRASSPA